MLFYEKNAILNIQAQAKETEDSDKKIIRDMLENISYHNVDIEHLIFQIFNCSDITLNFHPDRYSNNGNIIIDNLINDGEYLSQFVTGTSNGGRTAYPDGDRDVWEKNMFRGAYHTSESNESTFGNRPKYGALNIMNYMDGASARFGSCFFTLKPHVLDRCTFAFGDSSTNPDSLGVKDNFHGILKSLLTDAENNNRFLDKENFTVKKLIDYILSMKKTPPSEIGRNLDYCIETHIHGNISMLDDVEAFYTDESFRDTEIYRKAEKLSEKYDIRLFRIPERKLFFKDINDDFRGVMIPKLSARIIDDLKCQSGYINAELIGRASRYAAVYPQIWSDLGDEYDLFQNLKKLWHTVAFYG